MKTWHGELNHQSCMSDNKKAAFRAASLCDYLGLLQPEGDW